MTVAEQHPVIVELLCLHEMLRRLGYAADDIYVGAVQGRVAVIITRAGRLAALLTEHDSNTYHDIVVSAWPDAAEAWNAAPTSDLAPIWEAFLAATDIVRIVAQLQGAFSRARSEVSIIPLPETPEA